MAEVALAFTWVAVLFKAPGAWRRSASPARRALWLALLSLALGWTLRVPMSYRALDEALGVPNVAQPLGDGFALATGCAILGMLLYQSHDDEAAAGRKLGVRVLALIAALAVMGIAFAIGDAETQAPTSFVAHYATRDFFLIYSLAYLTYLAYVFADLTRLCRRYANLTNRRYLKCGLRLMTVAGSLGLLYVVLRAGYLGGVRAGYSEKLSAYEPVSKLLVAAVSIFAVTGASLPGAGSWLAAYRAHRQLHPLWAALYGATPGIALSPASSRVRELLSFSDPRFQLNSRIIEIRDGRMALRRYFRPDVAFRARQAAKWKGMTGQDEAAAVEAAMLAAAVEDKAQNRPPSPNPIAAPIAMGGADLDGELSFLQKVSRAYTARR